MINLNRESIKSIERDYITKRCNRARLYTGPFCNYKCDFCYYIKQLNQSFSFEEIKEKIDYLYNYDITEVDLSGGESAIHKNWFDILDYCNTKFEHISCLSNGYKFADFDFLKKSKEHGLKEILFSLHGYNEENHDEIVNHVGAYKRIIQAINNAHELDIIVRINTTVYQKNYNGLLEHAQLVKTLKPLEMNYITLNYWHDNEGEFLDYIKCTDVIKKCIDELKEHVKYINVRFTPYCFMLGYEKYICNQFQHIYDVYDWNRETLDYLIDTTKKYTIKEKIDMAYEILTEIRVDCYTKKFECARCKFYFICDGLENENAKQKVFPVLGDKIHDVIHYRKNFYV